jgi:hypothetical protein
MTNRNEEQYLTTQGSPKTVNDDRFTLVVQGHYLEFETGQTTVARWACDRLVPSKHSSLQQNIKINPGEKKEILLPEPCGSYELLLGHKVPQLQQRNDLLETQQKLNTIEIYNESGLVGTIGPERMMYGQFSGKLYASSTRSTSILHISAFPL